MPDWLSQIRGGLERQRTEAERISEIAGGKYVSDFLIARPTPGEGYAQLVFPVRYVEVPVMTFGGELAPNQNLLPGQFPQFSVIVHSWKFGRRPDTGTKFYDGCTLAIVTIGADDLSLTVHVSFRGKAVRNIA
jgi:hypothetical protein